MIKISKMISPDRVVDLAGCTKDEVIREMVEVINKAHQVTDKNAFYRAIIERENILSTGIGIGLAVPHAKISSVIDFVIAIGRKREGIEFGSLDGQPVYLVIMIAAPANQQEAYLRVLARIALMFKNEKFRKSILDSTSAEEVVELLRGR